ncbi:YusG family protein [Mesobacillus maritimus]|uniref:YusG family protein n=1 Tax=Mesobacillus maritimus TaxID=1643336 RepID=A0ABS7K464_9BACI|nr:YusG family protein [Mesobacillus maritimus]MBY0096989.1 YusG family protein [Mesobacillus maritimus]
MTLESKKLDVTDRITGKLNNGEIELYLENNKVGKITLPEGSQIQLEHHFETDQQKIYQHVSVPGQDEPRYTDCDEGGWC